MFFHWNPQSKTIPDAFILRDGLGSTAKVPKPVRVTTWERNPGGLGEKSLHIQASPPADVVGRKEKRIYSLLHSDSWVGGSGSQPSNRKDKQ